MSVILSLSDGKGKRFKEEKSIINVKFLNILFQPKLLGSSWIKSFEPLIARLRELDWRECLLYFVILSFDIYVDIWGCLPNYCSLWKYFDILHFNIRFKGHETQMLPHTKNNNDVVSLKYCFICYDAVIQIILNSALD